MTSRSRRLFSGLVTFGLVFAVLVQYRLTSLHVKPISIPLPELPTFPSSSAKTTSMYTWTRSTVQKLGVEDLLGPESMVVSHTHKNYMFVGLGDGRIVRIHSNPRTKEVEWVPLARTGEETEKIVCGSGGPTDTTLTEPICGRPLGMILVNRSTVDEGYGDEEVLLVADSYRGLLMITHLYDTAAAAATMGQVHVLATRAENDTEPFHLLNGIVQDPRDQSIYVSETSTQFYRNRIFYAVFDGTPTGRLLKYQPSTQTLRTVVSNLYMPNGLTLSHDQNYILIVCGVQILRYSLLDQQLDPKPFVPVMIGTGDNIKAMDRLPHQPKNKKQNCYWAGLGSKYTKPFSLLQALSQKPILRAILVALVPYSTLVNFIPKFSAFAIYDEQGQFIALYHEDPTTNNNDPSPAVVQVPWISEVERMGDDLYIGSWYNNFLGKISIHDLSPSSS